MSTLLRWTESTTFSPSALGMINIYSQPWFMFPEPASRTVFRFCELERMCVIRHTTLAIMARFGMGWRVYKDSPRKFIGSYNGSLFADRLARKRAWNSRELNKPKQTLLILFIELHFTSAESELHVQWVDPTSVITSASAVVSSCRHLRVVATMNRTSGYLSRDTRLGPNGWRYKYISIRSRKIPTYGHHAER